MRVSEPQHFWQPGPCLGFAVQMSNLNFPPPCVKWVLCPAGQFWNTAASLWPEILSWLWEDTPCSRYFPLALSWRCWSGWAVLARQDSVAENIPFLLSLSGPQNWNDNLKILLWLRPDVSRVLEFSANEEPCPWLNGSSCFPVCFLRKHHWFTHGSMHPSQCWGWYLSCTSLQSRSQGACMGRGGGILHPYA